MSSVYNTNEGLVNVPDSYEEVFIDKSVARVKKPIDEVLQPCTATLG